MLLSPWQKALGLMKDIRVRAPDVSDVRVVENPLGEVRGSGLKAGVRLPGLYYVARTIRLDRAFVVRRGVPALSFAVRNNEPLRSVLVSTPDAARAGAGAGGRAGRVDAMSLPLHVSESGDRALCTPEVADRTMWSEHLQPLARRQAYRSSRWTCRDSGRARLSGEDAPWRDVIDTIDALGIERAALVGNSFGGLVASAWRCSRASVSTRWCWSPAAHRASSRARDCKPPGRPRRARCEGDVEAAVQSIVETWTLADAPQLSCATHREHAASRVRAGRGPGRPQAWTRWSTISTRCRVRGPALDPASASTTWRTFSSRRTRSWRRCPVRVGPCSPAPGIWRRWTASGVPRAAAASWADAER